eukprot:1733387-Alexandrium_andersonii.AAC.1
MPITTERMGAMVFVVSGLDNPGTRVAWAVALVGGALVQPSYFLGNSTACLHYKRGCNTHRELWLSTQTREKHSEVCALLQATAAMKGSKIKLIGTKAAWLDRYNIAVKSHRGPNIIAVLGKHESKDSTYASQSFNRP